MSIQSVMPSNHLILHRPLLLPSIPPSIFPSIRIFANESVLCIVANRQTRILLGFGVVHQTQEPSQRRLFGWLETLNFFFFLVHFGRNAAAAAAAKSLQSCPTLCDPIDGSPPGSPVPGILQARRLEWVAISFSNIALTRQTFVGKVMSLLLNTLSRLVITFLSRSKRLLISWLQSPSAN